MKFIGLLCLPLLSVACAAADPLRLRIGEEIIGQVWLTRDATNLVARYVIADSSPLRNAGRDEKLLFKTGDSVDLQLDLGDQNHIRLLMTETRDGPIAVLYRYHVPGTTEPVRFWSPTGEVTVDRVETATAVTLQIERTATGYTLTATIPWAALGVARPPAALRGDVGVLLSDPTGSVTVERTYLFNKNTSVVADIPTEVRIQPHTWQPLP
jgi:hypothetical protein